MIKKAVITAAGSGSRLFPATKELAKEMLPLLSLTKQKQPILKPMLQSIFHSLYNAKIRNYCFIVGRNRRSVEDHFSIDPDLKNMKVFKKEKKLLADLNKFYHQLEHSQILFLQQQTPLGFGDAVLQAKAFVGDDDFFLHAGDDLVISNSHLQRLNNCISQYGADVGLLIQKVANPSDYGIVEFAKINSTYVKIKWIEEKPQKPKSNYAIVGIYAFKPIIIDYLKFQIPDKYNEIQLTSAIQNIIADGHKVVATKIQKNEIRIDIGTPQSYAESMLKLYKMIF